MALAIGRVDNYIVGVVERAAESLHARVWATDARGVVIASSEPDSAGQPLPLAEAGAEALVIPIHLERGNESWLTIDPLDGERISSHVARALIDLIISQTSLVARALDPRALKNQFVYNLLFEPVTDEAGLARQGQMLGIDLMIPRAVILIDAANYILQPCEAGPSETSEALMRKRATQVIDGVVKFFHLPADTICAYVGNGEVAVLKASTARDLEAWAAPNASLGAETLGPSWAGLAALKRTASALLARLRHDTGVDLSLGIGRYHPGIRGLARSYEDARAALALGRHFHGANQPYCLDSLGIAAFIGIADQGTKVDLARRLLGPLDQEPDLLDTLDAFFDADCSPSTTSMQLCIHRNTLNYRLDKVTSLTGLDPRHFDDAMQIRLALLLRSLS